jgi:hypothetical protein
VRAARDAGADRVRQSAASCRAPGSLLRAVASSRARGPNPRGGRIFEQPAAEDRRGQTSDSLLTIRSRQGSNNKPLPSSSLRVHHSSSRHQTALFAIALLSPAAQGAAEVIMPGSGYASQTEAIREAQETLRATFGEQIRFEPIPPNASLPRGFRVLTTMGITSKVSACSRLEPVEFKNGLGRKHASVVTQTSQGGRRRRLVVGTAP